MFWNKDGLATIKSINNNKHDNPGQLSIINTESYKHRIRNTSVIKKMSLMIMVMTMIKW